MKDGSLLGEKHNLAAGDCIVLYFQYLHGKTELMNVFLKISRKYYLEPGQTSTLVSQQNPFTLLMIQVTRDNNRFIVRVLPGEDSFQLSLG